MRAAGEATVAPIDGNMRLLGELRTPGFGPDRVAELLGRTLSRFPNATAAPMLRASAAVALPNDWKSGGATMFSEACRGRDRAFGAILHRQPREVAAMLMVLINIVIVIVVGAILFYLIDKYVRDGRLGNLLKILVALICLAAILQRLLPMLGLGGL
jgi:hypothetical protein